MTDYGYLDSIFNYGDEAIQLLGEAQTSQPSYWDQFVNWGGNALGELATGENLLGAGMAGLEYLGSSNAADEQREIYDQQFQANADRLDFDKQQHADSLRESSLNRALTAGKLAGDLASSQATGMMQANMANQQAAQQKQQLVQQAYQSLIGALLQGGGLKQNALGGLTNAAQRALI